MSEVDGFAEGSDDTDGILVGSSEGALLGLPDIEGFAVGSAEVVGCVDGCEEGASLWGNAPLMTKSEAVVAAAFPIALALFTEILSGSISVSKFRIAVPETSNKPGAISDGVMIWSAM